MSIIVLPTTSLRLDQPISAEFRQHGCFTFRQAAEHVKQLPYGRNSASPAYLSLLNDGRGTCSSKHALIAALACELNLAVRLILGIYEINDQNTPGIGPVLSSVGLPAIPEAHCWVEYGATPVDLTSVDAQSQLQARRFVYKEEIEPEQTGGYKGQAHRNFISTWLARCPQIELDADEIWNVRERCIAALSE